MPDGSSAGKQFVQAFTRVKRRVVVSGIASPWPENPRPTVRLKTPPGLGAMFVDACRWGPLSALGTVFAERHFKRVKCYQLVYKFYAFSLSALIIIGTTCLKSPTMP